MTNFNINVYIIAGEYLFHLRKNWPGTVRCPADFLQRRSGTVYITAKYYVSNAVYFARKNDVLPTILPTFSLELRGQ